MAQTNVEALLHKIRSLRTDSQEWEYNPEQQRAVQLALEGKSLLITGPAGSGKTSTSKMIVEALVKNNKIPPMERSDHPVLPAGSPAITFVSFTNKAIQNLKKMLPTDMAGNCLTIHKLLEYQPVFYDSINEETGESKTIRVFEPARHVGNPLPKLAIILIDEGTTVEIPLWNRMVEALQNLPQVIIVGDIHQLPPIFGRSIFITALNLGIEKVELTKIYRQAAESPIIALASRIKDGKQIPLKELEEFAKTTERGKVTIRPWKKKLSVESALATLAQVVIIPMIEKGEHDPYNDIILTPFNKAFGTIWLNEEIATYLAKKEEHPVWEIFSGIQKKYLRIGDKIIYRGMEGQVIDIQKNGLYYGKIPRAPSKTMDYRGIDKEWKWDPTQESEDDIDRRLEHFASHTDGADKISREASHKVIIYNGVLDREITLSSSGDLNTLDLGYCITVHKSIGSEWNRVIFLIHHSQAVMTYRELLYTAVTRAAKELYIICEPNTFVQGINSQRIPGNTLEEKIASFNRLIETENKKGVSNKDREPLGTRLLVN